MICGEGTRRKRRLIPLRQKRRLRKKKMLSAEASHREPMVEMISNPVHDEDQEDATPDDYEREIDRLDQAVRDRIR